MSLIAWWNLGLFPKIERYFYFKNNLLDNNTCKQEKHLNSLKAVRHTVSVLVSNAEFSFFQKQWTFLQRHSLRSRGKRWTHRWECVKLFLASLCNFVNKSERITRLRCWCWSWRLDCRKSGSDWVNWGRSITSSLASQRAGEERKRVRPLVKPQTSVCQQHNTVWPSAKTASASKIIPEFPSEQILSS